MGGAFAPFARLIGQRKCCASLNSVQEKYDTGNTNQTTTGCLPCVVFDLGYYRPGRRATSCRPAKDGFARRVRGGDRRAIVVGEASDYGQPRTARSAFRW